MKGMQEPRGQGFTAVGRSNRYESVHSYFARQAEIPSRRGGMRLPSVCHHCASSVLIGLVDSFPFILTSVLIGRRSRV